MCIAIEAVNSRTCNVECTIYKLHVSVVVCTNQRILFVNSSVVLRVCWVRMLNAIRICEVYILECYVTLVSPNHTLEVSSTVRTLNDKILSCKVEMTYVVAINEVKSLTSFCICNSLL